MRRPSARKAMIIIATLNCVAHGSYNPETKKHRQLDQHYVDQSFRYELVKLSPLTVFLDSCEDRIDHCGSEGTASVASNNFSAD